MLILGINVSHDAGVALVEDGHIVAAVSEERFNRKKAEGGVPFLSLNWLLANSGREAKEINAVALAGLIHRDVPPMNNDGTKNRKASHDLVLAELFSRSRLGAKMMGSDH